MALKERLDTWTYASANSVTTPGDFTGTYWPGMRVVLKQGTLKYFIIESVIYASPNTTITLNGFGTYTLTSAAITGHKDTTEPNPAGFPLVGPLVETKLATSKTTPVDNDELWLRDSVSLGAAKLLWSSIKSTLKTYFDGLYATQAEATTSVKGLDSAADKTKLDGIAAGANVTASALAPAIHAATDKSTLVDGDEIGVTDSAASYVIKHILYSELKTLLGGVFSTLTNNKVRHIEQVIDGGGSAIATGPRPAIRVGYACTIKKVTLLAMPAGAIVVDIWKCTYTAYDHVTHPQDADSITSATPPTITATNSKSKNTTLTNWTTAIAADDVIRLNVDSCTTIQTCTVDIEMEVTN